MFATNFIGQSENTLPMFLKRKLRGGKMAVGGPSDPYVRGIGNIGQGASMLGDLTPMSVYQTPGLNVTNQLTHTTAPLVQHDPGFAINNASYIEMPLFPDGKIDAAAINRQDAADNKSYNDTVAQQAAKDAAARAKAMGTNQALMYGLNAGVRMLSEKSNDARERENEQANIGNPLANEAYDDGRSKEVMYGYKQFKQGGQMNTQEKQILGAFIQQMPPKQQHQFMQKFQHMSPKQQQQTIQAIAQQMQQQQAQLNQLQIRAFDR